MTFTDIAILVTDGHPMIPVEHSWEKLLAYKICSQTSDVMYFILAVRVSLHRYKM